MEINEQAKTSSTNQKDQTTFKEAPILAIKGFLMGSADIVPGVSGGTMALILDIYERLLNAIKSVDGTFIKYIFTFKWKAAFSQLHTLFLISLFLGILSAGAFFTKVVPLQIYMFTHPEIVYGLFFGLIVGSIYILIKTLERITFKEIISIAAGIGIGLWVVMLVPTDTPDHPAFIFLAGMITISAMILPGISGSFLLLIMRKYDFLLTNISLIGTASTLSAIINILPFTLGSLVGIALFSRFLSWLLNKFHSQTIALLIGFLIGSLYVIWPFQHREYHIQAKEVTEIHISDPRVQEWTGSPDMKRPEFYVIGEATGVDTREFKEFKQKLEKSEPYIPGVYGEKEDDNPNILGAIIGMIVGVVLVGGLDKLRDYKVGEVDQEV